MNILISVETLLTGGAETFSLRLAQAFSEKNQVVLYRFYKDYINEELAEILAPSVRLVFFEHPFDFFFRKIDSLLYKLHIDLSIRNFFVKNHLRKLINEFRIEVIHSN